MVAVNIGVILATLHFMRRMSKSVEVQRLEGGDLEQELAALGLTRLPPGVLVYAIDGPFFFGAVENFEQALSQAHLDPKLLVIRLKRVPFMDITGLSALEEAVRNFRKRGVRVLVCEANPQVRAKLVRTGLLELLGEGGYVEKFASAMEIGREYEPPPPASHAI